MYKLLDYYCDVCDNPIKIKTKIKHLQSTTHIEFIKCIRRKHTIENTDFFQIDEIFIEYITTHNDKFDVYLVIDDFKLIFDRELYPHIESEFRNITTIFHLKRFLLH